MKLQTWALIILAAAFALYIFFDKDPEPNIEKIQALENGLAIADQEIIQLRKDSAELANGMARKEAQREIERQAHKSEVRQKDAVIAKLRENPIVLKVREETPEVDSLLDAMEAKDSIQTERIITLENDLRELRVDMAGVKFNAEEMLREERERFALQESLTKEYKDQLRKERRKGRLAKAGAVILGVGGFILGSQ